MSESKKPNRRKQNRRRKPQHGDARKQEPNPRAFDSNAAYGSGRPYLPSGRTPAELWPRFAARIIDGLIVGVPGLLIYRVLVEGMGGVGAVLAALIYGVTLVTYATFMESGHNAQTFGKSLLGLRVLGPNGGVPTRAEAFRRNSFYVLNGLVMMPFWLVQFIALAVLLAAFISIVMSIQRNPQRQGRHDEIADGTQVVRA